MQAYKFCDWIIESTLPLPELVASHEQQPACTILFFTATVGECIARACMPHDWLHHWRWRDGQIFLSYAQEKSNHHLRFPDLADFVVDARGKEIRCYPNANTDLAMIKHLLLDQVLPRVLSQRGRAVIHASGALLPDGAVAFLGESGWGKSTLAASFHQQGMPLLTDDCLLLNLAGEQVSCMPTYAGLRLWPDMVSTLFEDAPRLAPMASHSSKQRLFLDDYQQRNAKQALPIQGIYVLAPPVQQVKPTPVVITPLSQREALFELFKHSFQLDITDLRRIQQVFIFFSRIVKIIPFFRLDFPREHTFLPSVQAALLKNQATYKVLARERTASRA